MEEQNTQPFDFSKMTGLIPSPKDYRDINMLAVMSGAPVVPPKEFLFSNALPYLNQGQLPECVACTGATMESALASIIDVNITFDWQWLYEQCKLIDGLPAGTQGTTFKAMLTVLKNVGCKPMNVDASDTVTIGRYKIAGYVQVNTDFQSLKTAIYTYGVILMGFVGSNPGWQTAQVHSPFAGETKWQHATSGKGYVEVTIRAQNSWGQSWGDNGDFYVGEEYPPFEAWAILTKLPDNWENLLPQPKNKPKYTFTVPLTLGETSREVTVLQNCMKWMGCMSNEIEPTAFFGQLTLEAVKLYQERNNIPSTGYVGPLTIAQLNKDFS